MYISKYLSQKQPSIIRLAQTKFQERQDNVKAINVAIGNVSLPMHPAMQRRLFSLNAKDSPFKNGVVKYSSSEGLIETRKAFLNIIASSGLNIDSLKVQITGGASLAIELCVLGLSGNKKNPILIFDPIYTTYKYMAERLGRFIVSIPRELNDQGIYVMPSIAKIEKYIRKYKPSGILVIPYDNPTGQFISKNQFKDIARLCVKYDIWLISDEAYRELYYVQGKVSSVWGINDNGVPGIEGKRISIESASKVWNACGLRVGAIVSDSDYFMRKINAEYTIYVCTNVIGQYVFGALANESKNDLNIWYKKQREYYADIIKKVGRDISSNIPGVVVSRPKAAIYLVVDFSNITNVNFSAYDFAMYCAEEGSILLGDNAYTLLVSPIAPFYKDKVSKNSKVHKQIRISCVETKENMKKVPILIRELFNNYKSAYEERYRR
ncbi:MAG: pyridoxal phosphate-dependent aminotransferase [Candidatus Woesearchaeota archaeon]